MKQIVAAAAFGLLLLSGAVADEVWTSAIGDVEYEDEVEDVAIFTFQSANGSTGRLYFPGLAGNYEQRGTHFGYWIAPSEATTCPTEMIGADGTKSREWGELMIVFHSPAYPSSWTLLSGTCFGPMVDTLVGTAK